MLAQINGAYVFYIWRVILLYETFITLMGEMWSSIFPLFF